jgi:hypothetical protein
MYPSVSVKSTYGKNAVATLKFQTGKYSRPSTTTWNGFAVHWTVK